MLDQLRPHCWEITTVEGLSDNEDLNDIQQSLWETDAFQCGFCLPGHLFAVEDLLEEEPDPDEKAIRESLIGNLCRCTGYVHLVEAVRTVADRRCGRVCGTDRP